MNMYRLLAAMFFCLAPAGVRSARADDAPANWGRTASHADFLQAARRPFLKHAWGRFEGSVQHRGKDGLRKVSLELGLLMHPEYLRAQFILEGNDVYNVMQAYTEEGVSNVRVDVPETTRAPSLRAFGITPSDITFSFLYWEFMEEELLDRVRGQLCRVFRLRNPQTFETVTAWFSVRYLGVLRVDFFKPGAADWHRRLEFTDFTREGELYYVRTAQLRGKDWKTMVTFDQAELALTSDALPPENLFRP